MIAQEPHIRMDREQVEPNRHHANYGAERIVEGKIFSNQAGVSAQHPRPETVRQNDDASRLPVIVSERPSKQGRTTQSVTEHRRRDEAAQYPLRDGAVMERWTETPRCRKPIQSPRRFCVFIDILAADHNRLKAISILRSVIPNHHQTVGICEWQRPQKNRVDQGINGCRRAYAQGEREHSEQTKPRLPRVLAQGDGEVVKRVNDPTHNRHSDSLQGF
jgi:hypothetical protein